MDYQKIIGALVLCFFMSSGLAHAQDTTLAVTNAGNIGIGTSSPSAKLEVVGDIAVSGTVDGVDVSALDAAVQAETRATYNLAGSTRDLVR